MENIHIPEMMKILEGLNLNLRNKEMPSATIEEVTDLALKAMDSECYIDDNNDGNTKILHGIVVLRNGFVCPVLIDKDFLLGHLYINKEDGKLHLSKFGVGGEIRGSKFETVEKSILDYNSRLKEVYKNLDFTKIGHFVIGLYLK